jgi:hypothetical protein
VIFRIELLLDHRDGRRIIESDCGSELRLLTVWPAFYRGASEPAGAAGFGPVDFDRIYASATKNGGIEILGPPPFTGP